MKGYEHIVKSFKNKVCTHTEYFKTAEAAIEYMNYCLAICRSNRADLIPAEYMFVRFAEGSWIDVEVV